MSGTAPFTRWCAGIGILGAGVKSAADAMATGGVHDDRLHWFLALTVASHALLTIAVRVNELQVAGNPTVLTRQRRPYSLLPYGAIAVTYLLLILAVWRHQTATVPIALGGAALSTSLVVGRQLAAFRENARLLSELNDKVRELHETKAGLDALAEQLRHQAYHDALSGLPNRALYAERLDAVLASGAEAIVMVVDLDDFKLVNDEFGHAAGDALLRVVSGRILGCVRAGDTVARLGGDEFAVLLSPGSDPLAVAARIVAAVEAPVEVDGGTAQVGASVGIACPLPLSPVASSSRFARASSARCTPPSRHRPFLALRCSGVFADALSCGGAIRWAIACGRLSAAARSSTIAPRHRRSSPARFAATPASPALGAHGPRRGRPRAGRRARTRPEGSPLVGRHGPRAARPVVVDGEALLREADRAMYAAKRAQGGLIRGTVRHGGLETDAGGHPGGRRRGGRVVDLELPAGRHQHHLAGREHSRSPRRG